MKNKNIFLKVQKSSAVFIYFYLDILSGSCQEIFKRRGTNYLEILIHMKHFIELNHNNLSLEMHFHKTKFE